MGLLDDWLSGRDGGYFERQRGRWRLAALYLHFALYDRHKLANHIWRYALAEDLGWDPPLLDEILHDIQQQRLGMLLGDCWEVMGESYWQLLKALLYQYGVEKFIPEVVMEEVEQFKDTYLLNRIHVLSALATLVFELKDEGVLPRTPDAYFRKWDKTGE